MKKLRSYQLFGHMSALVLEVCYYDSEYNIWKRNYHVLLIPVREILTSLKIESMRLLPPFYLGPKIARFFFTDLQNLATRLSQPAMGLPIQFLN